MENTSKVGYLYFGILITIFIFLISFLVTVFDIINFHIISPNDFWFQYISIVQNALPLSISFLAVSSIVLVYLNRFVRKGSISDVSSSLKSFSVGAIIFVSVVVIAFTLAFSIYALLTGDLTTRFLLKVITLLIVFGTAITYYMLDRKNYWNKHSKRAVSMDIVFSIVMVVVIAYGVILINPPTISERNETIEKLMSITQISRENNRSYIDNSVILSADSISNTHKERGIEYTPSSSNPMEYQICVDLPYVLMGQEIKDYPYQMYQTTGRNCFDLSARDGGF